MFQNVPNLLPKCECQKKILFKFLFIKNKLKQKMTAKKQTNYKNKTKQRRKNKHVKKDRYHLGVSVLGT